MTGPKKIFVINNSATLICPKCGKSVVVNVEKYKTINKPIKVKCKCGHVYLISLEIRKFYRKDIELPGIYINNSRDKQKGNMMIKNLSLGGLKFAVNHMSNIAVDDRIIVKFTLDDRKKSEIKKQGVVRNVYKNFFGIEFLDDDYNKELGFYLMP